MGFKIRFGLIGCGRISEKHINALAACEDAELIAVCDIKEERAKELASNIGCRYYSDYKKMIKEPDMDIIDICTPNGTHANISIDVANAKKHVLTEKPMALTAADCDKMITACKDNKVRLFVVKQNRFNPPIVQLRKAVEKNRFGKLVLGNVTVRWARPRDYYGQNEWHGTKSMDGGMLFTQASHHIDMMQWMMGPVESVKAYAATLTHDIEVDDTAAVALRFKNGALGIIEATTCTFPKNIEGSIAILGEKGTAKIGGLAMNKIDHWEFSDFQNEDENIKECATNPPNVYGFGHNEVIRHVVNMLMGKGPLVGGVDGEEGKKSVRLIEAIYESARTGKEVFLD